MSSLYPDPDLSMVVDIVDAADHPVGTIPRREVLPSARNFRVAHLFLFNARGELLVQQLAPSRDRHPMTWGSSVAAYLFSGETYGEAIARRSLQELGYRGENIEEVGKTVMRDVASLKFITLFRAVSDAGHVQIMDSDHVSQIEFLPLIEIEHLLKTGGRTFTPTFQHLFQYYRSPRNG